MAFSAKIKLVSLAVIYLLHVAFFDALMGAKPNTGVVSFSVSSSSNQSSSKNNSTEESSYRLLTKHEQAKQALVNLPHAFDFVSDALTGFVKEQNNQSHFGALARLNDSAFKLYRLFRVFLI